MIIGKNLGKRYITKKRKLFSKSKKVVEAVKGIDITITEGLIVGLLGVNGAGKTTTIKMLSAITQPSYGTLMIDDIDALKTPKAAKEKLNVITGGERSLYWRLSAQENLEYFGALYGLSGVVLKDRMKDVLELTGLTEYADVAVERYSKGMKQRLQIARGLINDPKYLFLDEPTLGLDLVIAKQIREFIARLAKDEKKGILLTTHYLEEANELCDYIYVLHEGRIIAQGSPEELSKIFSSGYECRFTLNGLPEYESEIVSELKIIHNSLEVTIDPNNFDIVCFSSDDIFLALLRRLTEMGHVVVSTSFSPPSLENAMLALLSSEQK